MKRITFAKLASVALLVPAMYACATCRPPIVPERDATAPVEVEDAGVAIADAQVASDVEVDAVVDAAVVVDIEPFIDYVFTAMKEWVPPISQCYWSPDKDKYQACQDGIAAHHQDIAKTIVQVITDPLTRLPITGDNPMVKSALLMASIASYESHFARNADACTGNGVGDNGISFGLWQTQTPRSTTCNNRASALRQAIKIVNISFDYCKNSPLRDRLAAYACGRCDCGQADSEKKMGRAMRYLAKHPFTYPSTP